MELNKIIHGDCFEVLKTYPDNYFDAVVTDPPYGISFMNRKWDYQIPSVELWQEVLRVLKPGGHALVACGTRTQHRMAVNLEDAGFEIRDIVLWVYGSGFPKSLNVGKAVDKLQENEREIVGDYQRPDGSKPRKNVKAKAIWGNANGNDQKQTKGNSEWEGWGTALKPAVEFFTLCRKPLSESTVAKNVLKWGTGAINIDDCRVSTNDKWERSENGGDSGMWSGKKRIKQEMAQNGRFPANLIHDGSDEVVSMFPENVKGEIGRASRKSAGNYNATSFKMGVVTENVFKDSGSASRYFYCAKASPSERNMGCENLEPKQGGGMTGTANQSLKTGSGNERNNLKQNHHPTVKPIKLMRYLVRLITPPDGIVLDCFGGSGTTAIACIEENKNYVLIERESEYVDIAQARINAVNKDRQLQLDIS